MKKVYKLFVLSVAALAVAACSENKMDEINKDLSVAYDVNAKFIVPDLELRTSQNIVGGDFNTYFGSYVEYWAGTHNQLYKAEKRDAEVRLASTFNNTWGTIYENIRNAKIIIAKCADDASGKDAGDAFIRGVGEVMLAYNLAIATDVYGDTPYTQVGDVNKYPYPEADTQESIYDSIFDLLETAVVDFNAGSNTLGNYDLIYGGNVSKWIKFANGLLARYTMRVINRSTDQEADYRAVIDYVDNSFASAADQASMAYDNGNQNPMFDFQWSRDGISSSTSMFNKLKERMDPRADRAYWHSNSWEYLSSDDVEDYLAPTGDPVESQYEYTYDIFTFAEVAPIHYLSYHELQFLKAEALCRLGEYADAKDVLKGAIAAAFENFEINVQAAMNAPSINAYGGLEPADDNAMTAAVANNYFDVIVEDMFDANPLAETMLQKYIGMWGANGEAVETYADIRRLKGEENDVYALENPGDFPLRAPYGQDDVVANPNITKLYTNAGSYVFTDPVWWAGGSR